MQAGGQATTPRASRASGSAGRCVTTSSSVTERRATTDTLQTKLGLLALANNFLISGISSNFRVPR